MDTIIKDILIQAGAYTAVMLLTIIAIGMLFKGFFLKYIKVKSSFGKLVLIKVRNQLRDYFMTGWLDSGFLVFIDKKDGKKFEARICIDPDKRSPMYRCMGINWLDISEDKSSICYPDYSVVSGYDTKKYSDLMIRCLQRPVISSGQEKIMLILVGVSVLLMLGCAYLGFINYDLSKQIHTMIPNVCKGIVQAVAGV
jgi:hypothetical protein